METLDSIDKAGAATAYALEFVTVIGNALADLIDEGHSPEKIVAGMTMLILTAHEGLKEKLLDLAVKYQAAEAEVASLTQIVEDFED